MTIRLLETLKDGRAALGDEAVSLIRDFVLSQKSENDAFTDKAGREDVYYTSFGWVLSYVLGIELDTGRMGGYLDSLDEEQLDLVHYAAYMRCRMMHRMKRKAIFEKGRKIRKQLEEFRNIPNGDPESPYARYIWQSLKEDMGETTRSRVSLDRYRVETGGYSNISGQKTLSASATSAALMIADRNEGTEADVEALKSLQDRSGGFRAGAMAPLPDLLSTAVSLFTLKNYGAEPEYPARDFIEAHWLDDGGFAATLMDSGSDVEYVFYGLLALGTL